MNEEFKKLVIANYYQSLSDEQKKTLRDAFLNEFDYSIDGWYKKIRSNRFRPIEFKWFAKQLSVDIDQLNTTKIELK